MDCGPGRSVAFPKYLSFSFFFFKVIDHLNRKFAELNSPNKLNVSMGHGAKAWVSDFNHPHYMAGRKAMKTGNSGDKRLIEIYKRAISFSRAIILYHAGCFAYQLR